MWLLEVVQHQLITQMQTQKGLTNWQRALKSAMIHVRTEKIVIFLDIKHIRNQEM